MEICIIGKGSIGLRHGEIFHSLGFKIIFFRSFKSSIKKKKINFNILKQIILMK